MKLFHLQMFKTLKVKNDDKGRFLYLSYNLKNMFKSLNLNTIPGGNNIITIISEAIHVVMEDLGKEWDVKHVPSHKI